ncbi:hypothetical protein BC643_2309 [Mangrovibacterium diazotrophicum]|uniref:Uncharacterized protein n=1 Tax=Mangrovibacterium diazotrophicum TaxID=1261403 RepID=A0A419W927_9BACT|nr:hypothetical protein BC643_2309 [Mangrovibacterium diazotrophicum]
MNDRKNEELLTNHEQTNDEIAPMIVQTVQKTISSHC